MSNTDPSSQSRIIASPGLRRSRSRGHSAAKSRSGLGELTSGGSGSRPRSRRPSSDPLGMQLLKQALFPKRTQPVSIGRFRVLRLIGHGGMGAVYACYDELLDRKVAVKILKIESRDRDLASSRLIREGQALARLSHPNVVTVHEVGRSDDEVYVAMEFVRGSSLDQWAVQERTWRDVLKVFLQAGRGLIAAHRVGIIHRDFKPQNVIVSEDEIVKVLDFGLARASGEEVHAGMFESQPDHAAASSSELLRSLTVTGTLVGTPAYMSPEQYLGQPVTAASDQFSFCVSLYQCLYGLLPFSTTSLTDLRADVLAGRVTPAPLRTQAPGWIYKCLHRGMSAKPGDRYPTMQALLAALDRQQTARKTWIAAATTTALAGVVGFMTASSNPSVEICPDASAELVGVWDQPTQEAVRTAIIQTGATQAEDLLAAVVPQLDAYTEEWRQMRNEACLAHAEGRQGDGLFNLRTACLDQRRAGVQAVVDVFQTADAKNLGSLAQAAAALPSLAPCADSDGLLAEVSPPDDPALRERVQGHREELARANVLKYAGKVQAGIDLLDEISADEDAMAYLPLAAEVELHRGFLQLAMNDVGAEDSYEKSMHMAIRAGHLKAAAQASSRLSFFQAEGLGKLDRVSTDLPLVEALNSHVEGDIDLYAEYLNNLGWVRSLMGERRKARRLLEEADALRIKHNRGQTPLAVGTLYNLGRLAEDEGRIVDAVEYYKTAIERSEQYGSWAVRELEVAVASMLAELGMLQEAREKNQKLIDEAVRSKDEAFKARALFFFARCELRDGNATLARELVEQGTRKFPKDSVNYDLFRNLAMRSAAASGDSESVRRVYEEAQRRFDTYPDPTGIRRAKFLLDYGISLMSLGRPDEALVPLQKLQPLLTEQVVAIQPAIAPRLSLALGRAYRESGNLESAKSALEQALSQYGEGWPIERADTYYELGLTAFGQRQLDEAARLLTEAESIYTATADADFLPLARARFALARVLTSDSGFAPAGAREAAQSALEVLRAKAQPDDVAAVEAWLAQLQ